jgi:hypothetical protein
MTRLLRGVGVYLGESGVLVVYGVCIACSGAFWYDPELVPSTRVEGDKEPVCSACVEGLNRKRIAAGLDPVLVLPGAYVDGPFDAEGE